MSELADVLARVERLEALEEIHQLPAKYAAALDMRDLDALVNLFVDDIGVPGKQRGRHALKRWYARPAPPAERKRARRTRARRGHALAG